MTEKTKKDNAPLLRSLSVLKTLTVMQLKEKMDVSYLRSFKKTLFRVIFFIIEFVAITAICWLLFWAAKLLKVFDFNGGIPTNVLTAVFTVMFLLSVVFATVGLMNSLYLSRDNLVLLTFPATPSMVFLSKLLVYYVYELKKNFLFLIPFFCAYGISSGFPVYYYLWVIVWFVFIAALPVLLAALLSMPTLYAYQYLRKTRVLQYILTFTLFGVLIILAYYLISLIPENINLVETWGTTFFQIQHFLKTLEQIFLPVAWLTKLLVGTRGFNGVAIFGAWSFFVAIGLLGTLALLGTLCFVLAKPLFYKMASTPFEYTKRVRIKEGGNKKTPVFLSAVKKEWIVARRDGSLAGAVTQLVVIMPLAIALLNSLYQAMNTKFLGLQLTVFFNFLVVLLFMLSANIRIASAYSKDGFSAYLNKVQPSTYGSLLFSKLTVNLGVGFVGVVLATVVYGWYGSLTPLQLVFFGVSCYALFVSHLFWSGELDIMNPQYEQYATFSEQSNNPNENKSTLLAFLLSFLVAGVMLLLSLEDVTVVWYKILGISLVLAVMKIFTFFIKIKVYYKEK